MSAMPAEITPAETGPAESGPAPVRPVPVRAAPVRPAPRRSGSRARPGGPRPRPTGVRACSAVLRAEPAVAAPTSPASLMAPSAQAAAHAHPHLTRRGRSALVAGAVIVATLLWFAVASAIQGPARGMPRAAGHAPVSQVVVQPGQTLWSIALQTDPTADPRLVVQQIVSMNSLTGENIVAGQHLRVPLG